MLPALDCVKVVSKGCTVSAQLLISLPTVQFSIQDGKLQLFQLLDDIQMVVGKVGRLQLKVVELKDVCS